MTLLPLLVSALGAWAIGTRASSTSTPAKPRATSRKTRPRVRIDVGKARIKRAIKHRAVKSSEDNLLARALTETPADRAKAARRARSRNAWEKAARKIRRKRGKPDPLADILASAKPKKKHRKARKRRPKRKPSGLTLSQAQREAAMRRLARSRPRKKKRKGRESPAPAPPVVKIRPPEEAARDLLNYVTKVETNARRWGHKGHPNQVIKFAQADMGATPDGIYGPQTRRIGKRLIGKTFPPRK